MLHYTKRQFHCILQSRVLGSPCGTYKLCPPGLSDHFPIFVYALRLIRHFGRVFTPYLLLIARRSVKEWPTDTGGDTNQDSIIAGLYIVLTAPTPRIIATPFLTRISLLVRNYDEAITFYSRLGFKVVEDTFIPQQKKRWVAIRPPALSRLIFSFLSAIAFMPDLDEIDTSERVGEMAGGIIASSDAGKKSRG